MTNGFFRVAAVAPHVKIADVDANVDTILRYASSLDAKGVEVVVFPELSITGYTCGDLFHTELLLQSALAGLRRIEQFTLNAGIDVIVGLPVASEGTVFNCAAHVSGGVSTIIRKTYIPNYNEFYERRWFAQAPNDEYQPVIKTHGVYIGMEICEDLWVTVPPSCALAMGGAEVIFNLSASDELIGKHASSLTLIRQQSGRCKAGYVYASAGRGESSSDVVFSGKTIVAEQGRILVANDRWDPDDNCVIADIDIEALRHDRIHSTTFADCARRHGRQAPRLTEIPLESPFDLNYDLAYRTIDPHPFVPSDPRLLSDTCEEVEHILVTALAQRLTSIGCRRAVIGISGGLDSTLALMITSCTFDRLGYDRRDIIGITMPGFGTTDRTYTNALEMMRCLGITVREIPIAKAVTQHFADIGHDPKVHDATYENAQARERTQILMDVANQENAIVIGTGDMSEIALGWCTYNGDQMSMYSINAGVPKTLIRSIVEWFASRSEPKLAATLRDVVATPISPELTPADNEGAIKQKTEDLVGPYELHDFFLFYFIRFGFSPRRIYYLALNAFRGVYDRDVILHWLKTFFRRFFSQQFKRQALPDGPKVGSVGLSSRGDWRMPSDASAAMWLRQLDEL